MHRIIASLSVFALLALLTGSWAADTKDKTPPKSAKPQAEVHESLYAKLFRRVDFAGYEDPRMTFTDALDDLTKKYGVPFLLNEKAFKYENVQDIGKTPITEATPIPAMKNARIDTVLRQILSRIPVPSGATFLVRRDAVEITTGTFFQGEVWENPQDGSRLPVVQVLADKQPFDELIKALAEQAHFNILLDGRAGEKVKTAVSAELYNVPLDTALRLLASMVDLQPVRMDNVLYITSAATAEAMEKAKPKKPQDNAAYSWIISGPSGTLIRVPND
jgi:hypothetical protein